MSDFVSADIGIVEGFASKSLEMIAEFDAIKTKYETINSTLLNAWKGHGADAYKKETDHILENIGGIKDILDSINNGVLGDIKNQYNTLDEDLGEFNQKTGSEEAITGTSGSTHIGGVM